MKVKNGVKQRETIAVRINDELKECVQYLSDDCNLNIGAVMRNAIKEEYLKQKGMRAR